VGNRTSVNAGLSYAHFRNKNWTNHTTIGVQQYFDLTDEFLCSIQGLLKTASVYIDEDDFNSNYAEMPLTFQLHYFKERHRYFAGAEYSFHTFSFASSGNEKYKTQHFNSFLGMDYYLMRNVLINHKLSINWFPDFVPHKEDLPKLNSGLQSIRYSFGFVFLL
jgi:hypothetical protein